MARVREPQVVIDSFTSTLAPRWSRGFGDGFYGEVAELEVASNGDLMIGFGVNNYGWDVTPYHVLRISPDGLTRTSAWLDAATALVVFDEGYAIARGYSPTRSSIEVHAWDTSLVWSRVYDGEYTINRLARASDGTLVFAGEINATTNFGTGPLEPYWTPDGDGWNAYLAKLGSTGETLLAQKLNLSYVRGLATTGPLIAYSGELWTQLHYQHVGRLGKLGSSTAWSEPLLTEFGEAAGSLSMSSSGVVYANVAPIFHWRTDPWPFLITLD